MADKGVFVRSKAFLLLLILLLFILILTFFFGDSGIIEIVQAQKRIEELEKRIVALEQRKNELEREIEQLSRDPRSLEAVAREKLWLMKKDEKVIVVVPEEKQKDRGNRVPRTEVEK
ncbi:MAG: septum formation initiator family protein [Candidatus Aminicenantes bacterium]|nr:septum formation initiator family protein [Candidatus Aminicenantes bacterium]